jgi:hypothetical protein
VGCRAGKAGLGIRARQIRKHDPAAPARRARPRAGPSVSPSMRGSITRRDASHRLRERALTAAVLSWRTLSRGAQSAP